MPLMEACKSICVLRCQLKVSPPPPVQPQQYSCFLSHWKNSALDTTPPSLTRQQWLPPRMPKKFSATPNPQYSCSLVLPTRHQASLPPSFPPQPETVSSSLLKFSHLLSGLLWVPPRPHSFQPPTSHPERGSTPCLQPPQTLPCYPPHTVPPLAVCVEYKRPCCWQTRRRRDPHMHSTRPLSRFYTHQPARLCCHRCPFSAPCRFIPSLAAIPEVSFSSPDQPPLYCRSSSSVCVYFITIVILRCWWNFANSTVALQLSCSERERQSN